MLIKNVTLPVIHSTYTYNKYIYIVTFYFYGYSVHLNCDVNHLLYC